MTLQVTVLSLLALAAFVIAVMSSMNKAPLWVGVILLCVIELIRVFGH